MVDAWIAPAAGQTHFERVRLLFRGDDTTGPTRARVGRTPAGWAAVTDDGTLVALTPSLRSTLARIARLGAARAPGRPPAARRALALGTAFEVRVWKACRTIPAGRTLTYGELASRIGCRSAQAVGQALGRNPLCRLIPCHRVVARAGGGGFAWGPALKRRWLASEQA